MSRKKIQEILITVAILGFIAILGILGVSIATLIKVSKNNDSSDNDNAINSSTSPPDVNLDCMKKSTLPQASDNTSFNPVSSVRPIDFFK